jgi:hypothetical protein
MSTRTRRAGSISPEVEASPAKTPYRLLWSSGIVVGVLSVVAFVLWGINGPGTLFDLLVALCT